MPSLLFCSACCSCPIRRCTSSGSFGKPGGARELRRVHVGVAGEEVAQHVAEVLLGGLVPRVVGHAFYASPRPRFAHRRFA